MPTITTETIPEKRIITVRNDEPWTPPPVLVGPKPRTDRRPRKRPAESPPPDTDYSRRRYWYHRDDQRRFRHVPETDCWVWDTETRPSLYCTYRDRHGGKTNAHIAVWEALNGPVPDGLVLHHTCQNKHCVAPSHLVLLTPSEHTRLHAQLRREARELRRQAREEATEHA